MQCDGLTPAKKKCILAHMPFYGKYPNRGNPFREIEKEWKAVFQLSKGEKHGSSNHEKLT